MSANSNLNLNSRPYPLPPQVHNATNNLGSSRRLRGNKIVLGVNEQTGRLQWCPGFTCCKFLILLPVVMLPLALVLILLMRMDGMLLALRMQQQQQQQRGLQQHTYFDDSDYNNDDENIGDALADMVNEQLIVPRATEAEAERLRRCLAFKFGMGETINAEERDISKDERTSFLPVDATALPRDCQQLQSYGTNEASHKLDAELLRRRLRRDSQLSEADTAPDANYEDGNDDDIVPVAAATAPVVDNSVEHLTGLQTFWNEKGNKESIRQAQAETMRKYMDLKVNPCNDFFKYACGNWEKLHPIPRDKAGFDTFEMLRENLDVVLKQLLESNDADTMHPSSKNNNKNVVHINSNNFDNDANKEKDRVVATAPIADSKIVKISTGNNAAAASAAVPKALSSSATERKTATARVTNEKEAAALLRRRIVRQRAELGRLLERYQREATHTKRKRLVLQAPAEKQDTKIISNNEKNTAAAASSNKLSPEHSSEDSAHRKAKHLYQSCINSQLLERRGIRPLLQLIESLGGWPVLAGAEWHSENFDWLNLTAQLRRFNNDILLVQWVGPDIKNSDENVIQFDQTSLGLPTREYFLQETNAKYLHAYQSFMTDVMHKLGATLEEAQNTASDLIAFETRLASITSPAELRLNVTKLYKRMTIRQLHNTVPEIDWRRYLTILQQRQVNDDEEAVIYAEDYMHDLVRLLDETPTHTVSNYLLWRFVRHRINNVDDRFEGIKQNFYHALFGREESPSRWKVCIAQVNTNMGMALGSMFVSKYFDENSKRDTLKMTHELQQAFREILKTTDWLDDSTKHLAELKVNVMSLKIGYPDFILNPSELNEKYAGIKIHPDKYFENTLNVLLQTAKTEQSKVHEAVNKTTWQTAPAIVNAYYSRNKNQIMFPAGILQPPFYHRHFPRSLNFGGIGVVIGHELTHGFDDKGRLFDRNGSIHKWWTDASIKGFDERAQCIIAQYSNYTVGEVGITLNGESTQGENIADNGGLRQAFHAYKRWLRENPKSAADERLPGINMTGEQLFFLNFGQVWCGAMRPEAVRNKLNTAIHSPGQFRVIGTLSNSQDFAREFQCPLGSPMNPPHKCSVW